MISIVIPTYNRASHLPYINEALTSYLDQQDEVFELIYVDDCSTDDTAKTLKRLADGHGSVKAIVLSTNAGQQNATLAGMSVAKGDLVMTMDDDLRYGLSGIKRLTDAMHQGYDVVYGVAGHQNNGCVRRLGTGLKECFFALMCHKPRHVELTSFRVMTRAVADHVCSDTSAKVYISARILEWTSNMHSVSVDNCGQLNLSSNYTLLKLFKVFIWIFRNYTKPGKLLHLNSTGEQYKIKEIYP